MLCPNCSKLSMTYTTKICVRCQGSINNNLSCICDNCSTSESVCSICLKKITPAGYNPSLKNMFRGGCNSCRKG